MNTRRVPLADVPNAANSPLRAVAAAAAVAAASLHNTKRPRPQSKEERDALAQPPSKRQFVQTDEAQARRDAVLRRSGSNKETPLQKKLEAARRGQYQAKQAIDTGDADEKKREREKPRQVTRENADHIREWQRHYRRAFPNYTLYFDNVPEDVKQVVSKDVLKLNAVCATSILLVEHHQSIH